MSAFFEAVAGKWALGLSSPGAGGGNANRSTKEILDSGVFCWDVDREMGNRVKIGSILTLRGLVAGTDGEIVDACIIERVEARDGSGGEQ